MSRHSLPCAISNFDNAANMDIQRTLCEAIDTWSATGVAEALAIGANPNTRHYSNRANGMVNALGRAWAEYIPSQGRISAVLVALITGGAQVSICPFARKSFLNACLTGELETVRALIASGFELHGNFECLFTQHVSVLEFLLKDVGLDPDVIVERRGGALHHAVKMERADLVHLLLENHAKIEIRDVEGYTPLLIAAEYQSVEMIKQLLAAGADITALTFQGNTALHLVNNMDAAIALIQAGAVIDRPNATGLFPEDMGHVLTKSAIEHWLLSETPITATSTNTPSRRL